MYPLTTPDRDAPHPASVARVRRFLQDRINNDLSVITLHAGCDEAADPAVVLAAAERIARTVSTLTAAEVVEWEARYRLTRGGMPPGYR